MKKHQIKLLDVTKDNDALKQLIELERIAYEGTSHAMMQSYTTWEDVAYYCDCSLSELRVYMADSWYVLLAEHEDYVEFVDLASKQKHTPLLPIINTLTQYQKPFIMDCRESTSYRMIKALEKAGRINVLEDEEYTRDGEVFHDIRLEITNKQKLFLNT